MIDPQAVQEARSRARLAVIRTDYSMDDACEQQVGEPCRCASRNRSRALDANDRLVAAEARYEAHDLIHDLSDGCERELQAAIADVMKGDA